MTHRRSARPGRTTLATAAAIVGGCSLLAGLAGCATPGSPAASTATPTSAAATAATVAAAPVAAAPVAAAPVAAAPVAAAPLAAAPVPAAPAAATSIPASPAATPASPASAPVSQPAPVTPVATTMATKTVPVPHFTTPDAAMRYLAAAYNSGNEAAIRHVTTPDSRGQFESERQWVKTFRFRDCTANGAPAWDYTCVLDIVANAPGVSPNIDATTGAVVMDEVALLVAPAARTGYYLEANQGCGG